MFVSRSTPTPARARLRSGCSRKPHRLFILETRHHWAMTLIWFVVWLISNVIGDHEPLLFDPVNWWTGTLLGAIAIDLSRQHASKHF